ncbi:hypothetical protein EDB81DRAFT_939863 [Dactylonectria macrodidyma]|uniref:BZIP domain-containing protein n=1 Tax=Dactylonectria macrodidyma TaxID=307937 RepID=A0A9P9FUD4_9HYPO|nr:hypothetical protein EDB81DRAFT_939863 [Dactylonectria macrodidyma]
MAVLQDSLIQLDTTAQQDQKRTLRIQDILHSETPALDPELDTTAQQDQKRTLRIQDILHSETQALDPEERCTLAPIRPLNTEVPSATYAPLPLGNPIQECDSSMPSSSPPQAQRPYELGTPQLARNCDPSMPSSHPSTPEAQQLYKLNKSQPVQDCHSNMLSSHPSSPQAQQRHGLDTCEETGSQSPGHPCIVAKPFFAVERASPQAAPSSWPETTPLDTGAVGRVKGQQFLMALPGSGAPIPVQVDYSQGSQSARRKRTIDARASARHRQKKKACQEEIKKELEELQKRNQALEIENKKLTEQLAICNMNLKTQRMDRYDKGNCAVEYYQSLDCGGLT